MVMTTSICVQAYKDALSKKGFLRLRASGSGTSYKFDVGKVSDGGQLIRPLTFSLRCAGLGLALGLGPHALSHVHSVCVRS